MKKKKGNFISYTQYAFSQDEVKKLLLSCPTSADYIMLLLAIRYGFRREDVVNLKLSDIDLENAQLTFFEKKKDKSRTIPIEADVVAELRRYLNTLHKDTKYLLPFRDGTTAWRHLQEICEIAGIKVPPNRTGRPFHACRGTCVKLRQKQGWTLNAVAALLGDTVTTVAEHYATTTPAELADLMKSGSGA